MAGRKKKKMTPEERLANAMEILNKLMTTRDVMKKFGVSNPTVAVWVKKGLLHAVAGPPGVGNLFDEDEVNAFERPKRGALSHQGHKGS